MTTLKVGNTLIKIYHWRGKSGYDQFKVVYHADGQRKRETFGSLAKAKARAQEIAVQIERGDRAVLKLTSAEVATYLHARRLIEPLSIPLNVAVEEYVAARSHLQDGESILVAAKAYAKRSRNYHDKLVAKVVDELLENKKQNGASARYLKTLRSHLKRFAHAFQTNIGSVTTGLIEQWLSSLKVGPRARNNNRASVITLFHFAQKNGFLPKGEATEADAVDKVKDRGGKVHLLTPKQMAKLMRKATGKPALFFALGGFAGIRTAEILRLEWKDFNFVRGHITIAADKAKTATRRLVPILPNLAEYLRPYQRGTGRLFKDRDEEKAIGFAKKNGIDPWPTNCLRHSYASYRLATTADAARTALELGNSPAKLFSNYRELADEHDAKAWFAIAPKRAKVGGSGEPMEIKPSFTVKQST
jgi:integrase